MVQLLWSKLPWCMVWSGALKSILGKCMFQYGFEKPYCMTLLLFVGMSFGITFTKQWKVSLRHLWNSSIRTGMIYHPDEPPPVGSSVGWIVIPAFFDLVGTFLNFISIMWLPVALNEVIRSAMELLATAACTSYYRKKPLEKLSWVALCLVSVGSAIASAAHILWASFDDDLVRSRYYAILGLVISIPRTAVAVIQNISEEVLLQDLNVESATVVGMEGIFGVLLWCIIVLPIIFAYNIEDEYDAWLTISHSPVLAWLCVAFLVMTMLSNLVNCAMTKVGGVVHKEVWRALRPTCVWMTSLALFYLNTGFGESFNMAEGIFRIIGFVAVFSGVLVYSHYNTATDAAATAISSSNDDDDDSIEVLDNYYSSDENTKIIPGGDLLQGYGSIGVCKMFHSTQPFTDLVNKK